MKTKKKTLHKPESLTVKSFLQHIEPFEYRNVEPMSERWSTWLWWETRVVKRGNKEIHYSSTPCEPPKYHLETVEEMRKKEQRDREYNEECRSASLESESYPEKNLGFIESLWKIFMDKNSKWW
jgi:hypothetical protein